MQNATVLKPSIPFIMLSKHIPNIKKVLSCAICVLLLQHTCLAWGFFAHRLINYHAVFLLPPEMLVLYKPNIGFLSEHAVDPDKRRYAIANEGPRHYIDLDQYGAFPFDSLPRIWDSAVAKFGEEYLEAHGIVPWHIQAMLTRLTAAFAAKDQQRILKLSADIGHYISDAHVPLHACKNHNGQYTNQHGIHGFWESRIPELFAEEEYDLLTGTAMYLASPGRFIWSRVLESAAASDTVLMTESALSALFPADQKFAFEERLGKITRQYSNAFSRLYQEKLNGMVERRFRQSIMAVAAFWYTAWVNAGKPDLRQLNHQQPSPYDLEEYETLNRAWQNGRILGREH